jgi:hypothetical protein
MGMTKSWTKTEAFEYFRAKQKNPRWSWSARSEDGKTVVLTLWQDHFIDGGRKYLAQGITTIETRLGHLELMENLRWAIDHCDGVVRAVMAVAVDTKADPRSIAKCFPHPTLKMKIVKFEPDKKRFLLERIDEA